MKRTLLATALATSAAVALGGCHINLQVKREIVVRFTSEVDPSGPEAAAVRAACPGGTHVVLEPPSTVTVASEKYTPIRYNIQGASDAEYGPTLACLNKQPGVYSSGIVTQGDG